MSELNNTDLMKIEEYQDGDVISIKAKIISKIKTLNNPKQLEVIHSFVNMFESIDLIEDEKELIIEEIKQRFFQIEKFLREYEEKTGKWFKTKAGKDYYDYRFYNKNRGINDLLRLDFVNYEHNQKPTIIVYYHYIRGGSMSAIHIIMMDNKLVWIRGKDAGMGRSGKIFPKENAISNFQEIEHLLKPILTMLENMVQDEIQK